MKKFLKRVGSLFTAAVIALTLSVEFFCTSASAIDNNYVRGCTVAITFFVRNADYCYMGSDGRWKIYKNFGDNNISQGSGFFIGKKDEDPSYIVTNHHVVKDYIDAGEGRTFITYVTTLDGTDIYLIADSCEMRIYYSENDYDVAYVDCYGDQDKVDLAVLRLRNPTNKRKSLAISPVSDDNITDTVYIVGYPGIADNSFTGASKFGVNDSTVHKGTVSRIVVSEGTGVERVNYDATSAPGNSGGPVVNENNCVVAVHANGVTEGAVKENYGISSNELIRFLDKNDIPYEKDDGSESSAPASAESSADAGSSAATESSSTSPAANSTPASESNSGPNIILIVGIIIGVVVIAAIIIVVVVVSKKKSAPAAVTPAPAAPAPGAPYPAQPDQQQNQPKAVIRSMSVQHNGKAFPVGKAPVTVGRNTGSCVIVYKEGTQGVSGNHCTISFDSATGLFTVTDLKSTYGTYLLNGQKLVPNTPTTLRPGDSFYVGDKQNVLRVELVK